MIRFKNAEWKKIGRDEKKSICIFCGFICGIQPFVAGYRVQMRGSESGRLE